MLKYVFLSSTVFAEYPFIPESLHHLIYCTQKQYNTTFIHKSNWATINNTQILTFKYQYGPIVESCQSVDGRITA